MTTQLPRRGPQCTCHFGPETTEAGCELGLAFCENCGIVREVLRRTTFMRRLSNTSRFAALPAGLRCGSEWASSVHFS